MLSGLSWKTEDVHLSRVYVINCMSRQTMAGSRTSSLTGLKKTRSNMTVLLVSYICAYLKVY